MTCASLLIDQEKIFSDLYLGRASTRGRVHRGAAHRSKIKRTIPLDARGGSDILHLGTRDARKGHRAGREIPVDVTRSGTARRERPGLWTT